MALPRIAILGGGVGAVTTAYYLSADGWEQRFESITIYQQGWRLGGKGASGRGVNERIEEHGLHIWFGFYENAFRMLDECHSELDSKYGKRWSTMFTSVSSSFRPCSTVSLTDHDGCDWKIWTADFPYEDDDAPWLPRQDTWTVATYLVRTLELAAAVAGSVFQHERQARMGQDPNQPAAHISLAEAERQAQVALSAAPGAGALRAAAQLTATASRVTSFALLPALDVVLELIDRVLDAARLRLDGIVRRSDNARRAWYVLDLLLANVRGVVCDGVVEANDFDLVDDWDYCDWLVHHGAMRESVDSALVRALVYDLAFAYEDGDPARPRCGAGTALRGLTRTFFGYRGALMYRMNSGMGDVVFAPLYELLVKRGVRIKFFHRVEQLHVNAGAVTSVDIDVQARIRANVGPQRFLEKFTPNAAGAAARGATSYWVWPSRPAIPPDARTRAEAGEMYESYWGTTEKRASMRLQWPGGGPPADPLEDSFDFLVFGLSIGSVPYVAHELMDANPRWNASVIKVKTVATQALQLWLNVGPEDLGPDWQADAVVGGFVEPFDTWADMKGLTLQERVPKARSVAYFCNVLPDPRLPAQRGDPYWVGDQKDLVKANALRFVKRDLGLLWPAFSGPRWDWLVDPRERVGQTRLDAQFWRANVEPSERYVLSVPGSSQYRIAPDNTGFTNLYAVGDWTACKINAGCVEAAVISGLRAANAINGSHNGPVVEIVGWDEP